MGGGMFRAKFVPLAIIATAGLGGLAQSQDADTVYTNGKIYTVNEAQPWAEAVAIEDGKFIVVGSNDDVAAVTGDTTEVIDLGGGFAMPGLHDSHVHPPLVYTFEEAGELLFPETTSPVEIIKVVKAFADENPDLKVVRGQKWAAADFPGGKATKEWLDPHFPDRAIYLVDETGHNAVANSRALEIAGITKDTPDPENGAIDRDPTTGEPTGYLSETAMGLVAKFVKRPDVDANYRGLIRSLDQIRAYGITSVVDMAVGPNSVAAYQRLEAEGILNIRVHAAIALNDYAAEATTEEESEALLAQISELDSPLLDFGLKYWADGTPLSKTALMVEPYADDPNTHGIMTIGERQFERIKQAHRDGIPVRLHATTDGTTRKLLDVIAQARAEDPKPDLRHHIGHLLTVTKEDIPRFKELNVIAEFSPVWWYPTAMGKIASTYIGAVRYARWMAIKEFLDAGVIVAVGSDWPAGTPDADPWKGIEGMITRMDPHTNEGETLGEPVDLETAIKIYTMNGAMAMMHEDVAGSIEVGKHADMIVLERNLFEIDPTEISEVVVQSTVFAGEEVHTAPQ
jgi:predicted amidohydrolase YtcJ